MYNTLSTQKPSESFTFRASWYRAINRIRSKSVRNRIINHILEYAFTHRFVLTGNSTIDSLMILITSEIDQEFGWRSGIEEPEPVEAVDNNTDTDKETGADADTGDNTSRCADTEITIHGGNNNPSGETLRISYPPGAIPLISSRYEYFDRASSQ